MNSPNFVQKITAALPAPLLRSIGRIYDKYPYVRPLIDAGLNSFIGEGVIQRGPGKGLKINASGRRAGYLLGTSDYAEQRLIASILNPGDVLYEIGANIGFFVLLGARYVKPNGFVYAFEPDPKSVDRLRRNVFLNKFQHIDIIEAAVCDQNGTVILNLHPDSGKNTIEPTRTSQNSIEAQSIRLDSWVKNKRPPDIMKVDVEGAEIEVLQGAMKTVKQFRPILIIEVHGIGVRFSQFVDRHLSPLGYTATTLQGGKLPDHDGIRYHAILRT